MGWIPDYLDDVDADFLAIYGIDLAHEEMDAQRFFSRATRLFAFRGVMAERLRQEQEEAQHAPTPQVGQEVPASRPGETVIDLDEMRAQFADVIG